MSYEDDCQMRQLLRLRAESARVAARRCLRGSIEYRLMIQKHEDAAKAFIDFDREFQLKHMKEFAKLRKWKRHKRLERANERR